MLTDRQEVESLPLARESDAQGRVPPPGEPRERKANDTTFLDVPALQGHSIATSFSCGLIEAALPFLISLCRGPVIRDQCEKHDAVFFFKQWGRRNKKAAGRELNGAYHDTFPTG